MDRPHVEDEEDQRPEDGASFYMYGDTSYDPSKNVQDLLNTVKSPKHRSHPIFCEMSMLKRRGDTYEWRETARWVKYEEQVEEGGKRWSKPHVASLSMHYIMEMRKHMLEGIFLKDVEVYTLGQVIDHFLEEWTRTGHLDPMMRPHIKAIALKQHRHRHERGRPEDKKNKSLKRGNSSSDMGAEGGLRHVQSGLSLSSNFGSEQSLTSLESEANQKKTMNEKFLRKLPKDAETANFMVGEIEDLHQMLIGFMRLNDGRDLGNISEVPIPTRFIVYLLGPVGTGVQLKEMGRCLATMMVDEVFREVAYKSRNIEDLVAGSDEFLEQVIVLPPGEWDPKIRIEPPKSLAVLMEKRHVGGDGDGGSHDDPDLIMSPRPLAGLFADIKRKAPFYLSDFTDAFHIQCLPAFIFIFLATLTNNVTFGALLGQGTGNYMGVMECIFAGAVSSMVFALFAGQPLNILGSTGPMLVLENIIYDLCNDNGWDFLSLRFWVGIWTAGFLLLIVIFNLSALVRYLTRFTEESFACLIAIIFIYESFKKLAEIAEKTAPLRMNPEEGNDMSNVTEEVCNSLGDIVQWECHQTFVSDVFLMCLILFFVTFGIALFLVEFRQWPCFPNFVRSLIGDFSILIAILVCVGIDAAVGLPTPKLTVPTEFKPTNSELRGWVVEPISATNPWWLYLAAGLPALLATILIFMDQQITAVIVNRADHKLVKGKGYHLDLLVVAVLVAVHSLLGLPWYVAATVNAIAHINSLKKESESTAPGEKPTFLGVREQRVTNFLMGVLSAAAVFITNILQVIPMPVLYGVFFYMGYSALRGMQLIDRILLVFMPVKYQPDHIYLRHVPLWRVHLFTFIQILCLVALWVVKSIKSISIVFPLLVVFTGVVRKMIECIFTQYELKYIDQLLPGRHVEKDDKPLKPAAIEAGTEKKSTHSHSHTPSHTKTTTDSKNGGKASFFIHDEPESPPAYENGGFDTKL
ncbi:hypothetical protein BaRGS_00008078 [Batillaria attramentaria]|uniref:Anion exchange protein n=1 Tax=Batillaria attramentaria TaxID=370345 RepID=A0ABD0LN20_9CAEN